jgi:hypothetical protein
MWIALAAICHAANTLLMLLALAAFLLLGWFQRNRLELRPLAAGAAALISTLSLVAFVTFVYSTLQAEPRYSIPFRPLEILLALTTLYGIATWWQKRKRETSNNLMIHDAPGDGE